MTKVKINYATGGYYFTDTYGKVKVLGCKPVNVIRVQQEDGTILDLTCVYASCNALNVSKVDIVNEDEGGSDSDSSVSDSSTPSGSNADT